MCHYEFHKNERGKVGRNRSDTQQQPTAEQNKRGSWQNRKGVEQQQKQIKRKKRRAWRKHTTAAISPQTTGQAKKGESKKKRK